MNERSRRREEDGFSAFDRLPLPPASLRFKVIGNTDSRVFLDSGANQAAVVKRHLADALAPGVSVLDFGMGCGRLARHWRDEDVKFHGSDYNAELVAWVQANLPFVRATRNDAKPPLPYPDGFLAAIYAISVLTHWPAESQVAWLSEFRRVLSPGGLLFVTTHGEGLLGYMLDSERSRFHAGEMVVRNERSAGSNLCTAYHPATWVRAHLLDGYQELSYTPHDPAFAQDVWLLSAV